MAMDIGTDLLICASLHSRRGSVYRDSFERFHLQR